MTKKDYVLIASVFEHAKKYQSIYGTWKLEDIILMLANKLQAENPRFDRAKFLLACGVTE